MMFDVKRKVAIITGAASGIGKDAANCLAEAGASVVLLDRNDEGLQISAKEISKKGFKCLAFQCDVTNERTNKKDSYYC